MADFHSFVIALGIAFGLSGSALAQTPLTETMPKRWVMKGVQAFPRLEQSHPVARAINQALEQADARVAKAAKECTARESSFKLRWERKVQVTMNGPLYVSYVASDNFYCGGLAILTFTTPLVFDLKTGKPINWLSILPAELHAQASRYTQADGTQMGTVKSEILNTRYVEVMDAENEKAGNGKNDCPSIGVDNTVFNFRMWPDVATRSLVFDQDDLSRVMHSCGRPMIIPLKDLRKAGYAKAFLDALEMAPPVKVRRDIVWEEE